MRSRRAALAAIALSLTAPAARAQQPAPPPAAAAPGATGAVYGVVYDSLTGGPSAGAYVQLMPAGAPAAGRAVAADTAGAFRVDSLAPGRYLVGLAHPLLDLLRIAVAPQIVEVGPGADAVRVDLGVPGLAAVRPAVCGGSAPAPADSSALLAGRVRDAATGAPVAGATVVLTWAERVIGAGGVQTEHRRVPVTAGPGGAYVVCGLPAGEELVASAAAPGRASGEVALELPPRGGVVRDLALGDTASAAAAPTAGGTAAAAAPVARGTARVTGTVRDPGGRPVRGARAAVRGTAAEATANADGAFTLGGLPAGTRTLEVRALGFAVRRVPVDLVAGQAAAADVRLERVATLAPVTVFGKPSEPSRRLQDFLDRRRNRVFGQFLTAEDIARTRPTELTAALRMVPGLRVAPDGPLGDAVLGRGGCRALVVVDGIALQPGDVLDRWVSPQDVAGIEYYAEAAFAPPEYAGARLLRRVEGRGGGVDVQKTVGEAASGAAPSGGQAMGGAAMRSGSEGGGCGVLLIWSKQ